MSEAAHGWRCVAVCGLLKRLCDFLICMVSTEIMMLSGGSDLSS